jgi:hypothetical protein
MIPNERLHEIIEKYWDVEKGKVNDYDFEREALIAELILELRSLPQKLSNYTTKLL